MSFLFTLDESTLGEQLIPFFESVERSIKDAEKLFEIDGYHLEKLARDLPKHQAEYGRRLQEVKYLGKWLENHKSKLESQMLKNYSRGPKALSASDTRTFIAGEKDIIEINQLIIEANLFQGQLDEIVESFKQMGWMIGNITKLRVADLHDVII